MAVVSGRGIIEAVDEQGAPTTRTYASSNVLIRRDGRWLLQWSRGNLGRRQWLEALALLAAGCGLYCVLSSLGFGSLPRPGLALAWGAWLSACLGLGGWVYLAAKRAFEAQAWPRRRAMALVLLALPMLMALGERPVGRSARIALASLNHQPVGSPWSFDATVNYSGPRPADALNRIETAGFTSLALGTRYRFTLGDAPALLRLRIGNVTDKDTWFAGSSGLQAYTAPRRVDLLLTVGE